MSFVFKLQGVGTVTPPKSQDDSPPNIDEQEPESTPLENPTPEEVTKNGE